jgi:flagellar basal body rod protein FlgF
MLQLANNGNIEIITDQNLAGTEACVDSLKLKLLTADRLQDRFDEMEV